MTYEEAEGLTPAMVREHLERTGWKFEERQCFGYARPGTTEGWIPESPGLVGGFKFSPAYAVKVLAQVENRSPQSILREINPRMRKGWPTDEAMAAHPGKWLMGFPGLEMIISWEPFTIRERRIQCSPTACVEHWPIDDRGNKLPCPSPPRAEVG